MPLVDLDVRHISELGADSAYSRLHVYLWILPTLLSHGFNELLGNLLRSHIDTLTYGRFIVGLCGPSFVPGIAAFWRTG